LSDGIIAFFLCQEDKYSSYSRVLLFCNNEAKMDFAEWLQKELNKRGWSHSELARYSGVSPGQISRVANGSRGAGPDLCIAIAKGLGLARSEVFQARGWLVSYPEDPWLFRN
jgi:ribosome-binding protein aMBF1 (putative translation factor)